MSTQIDTLSNNAKHGMFTVETVMILPLMEMEVADGQYVVRVLTTWVT